MTVVTPSTAGDIIQIMRNITGRTDSSDPAFTDTVMLQYLNDFIQSDVPQDLRLFEHQTWLEFNIDTTDNLDTTDYPIDLDDLGFSTIQPPAYVGGFEVFWYQDPALFYGIWPETQTYQQQRPTYILWYNGGLTFRGPPDQQYSVKISGNKVYPLLLTTGALLPFGYLDRYYAYGASLNILSDYSEMQRYAEVEQVFKKQRANVLARTWQQYNSQRVTPEF